MIDALDDYDRAIALDAANPDYLWERANVRLALADRDGAVRDLRHALDLTVDPLERDQIGRQIKNLVR